MNMGHHRFLLLNHALGKRGKHFQGKAERRTKPDNHSGKDVFNMVKDAEVVFGKGPSSQLAMNDANRDTPMWKKKSIFWELPFWQVLEVRGPRCDRRDAPDKESLSEHASFMGVYEKAKDTLEARQDLQCMKEWENLHLEKIDDGRQYLSPTSYILNKEEKEIMFQCLNSIKVPSGFSLNVKGIINVVEKKFLNLKSCDCHMLMMQLLLVALRGILPPNVWLATLKLCAFLNAIS
jgi:hypothetical protein